MTQLPSKDFFTFLSEDVIAFSNSKYRESFKSADWTKVAQDIRTQVQDYWSTFESSEPVGVLDICWDDSCTAYCIEFDIETTNDLKIAFKEGCIDNTPVIDFSTFIRETMNEEPEDIRTNMGDDYETFQNILSQLSIEVIFSTLDNTAFKSIPKLDPHYIQFASNHDAERDSIYDSSVGATWSMLQQPNIPDTKDMPPSARFLDFSGRSLRILPDDIGKVSGLYDLNLAYNRIHSLPHSLASLALNDISLIGNQLQTLPTNLCAITSLTSLNLSNNFLDEWPSALRALERLKHLSASRNRFHEVDLDGFNQLTHLNLSENPFTEFPRLSLHPRLEHIMIREGAFTKLPDDLSALGTLNYLSLSDGLLEDLGDIGALGALTTLQISGCKLKTLPESIGKLSNLIDLSIKENALSHLPKTLGYLISLKYLRSGNNQLKEIPTTVGELPVIEDIDLNNNLLTNLPQDFAKLRTLEEIRLDGNPLSSIPKVLFEMTWLKKLILPASLKGNAAALQEALPSCKIDYW